MYETSAPLKFAEEDDFEQGCLPGTGTQFVCDGIAFSAETVAELVDEIAGFFGVPLENVELDADGEPGRIDVVVMEDADGLKALDSEIEQWKRKELRLWDVTYTFNVEQVSRTTVSLKGAA